MQAAREIAATEGLAGLRAEAVVARAGTAKGTFFAHFPDKDHLVAALVAERLATLPIEAAEDVPGFLAACGPLLALMLSEPEIVPVMARFSMPEGDGSGMGAAIHARIGAMAGQIGALQSKGRARAADPGLLAEGMMAFLFHAAASALCVATSGGTPGEAATAQVRELATLWLAPQ
jgi:AcrR family transcriptional regulator